MADQLQERFKAWFKEYYVKHGFITSKEEALGIWLAASSSVREEALELAAKICESHQVEQRGGEKGTVHDNPFNHALRTIAAAIRTMKSQPAEQAAAPEQPPSQPTDATFKDALADLIWAMRQWGHQEDGIPDFACAAFNKAMVLLRWEYGDDVSLQALSTALQSSSHSQPTDAECEHDWIANSGRGGDPSFRLNRQVSEDEVMHVMCSRCGARTWKTQRQWSALQSSAPLLTSPKP